MNKIIFSISLFVVALAVGPLRQLEFLANMPGDIIDSRLNNYFLENIYLYFQGLSASLLHLGYFYPYPFVGGFSDNLFGASPVYLVVRYFTFSPEIAFQIWYLTGFFANFLAAYVAIRILGQSHSASTLGAIYFTFGLPATAQIGHPQLQYRFGIPLAIVYFYQFMEAYNWRALLISLFWLCWQFFCTIYLGFFTVLYIIMMIISALLYDMYRQKNLDLLFYYKQAYHKLFNDFMLLAPRYKILFSIFIVSLLLALYGLFYPYLKVSSLYHFSRQWVEVSAMLPRVSSYFLADHSLIWGEFSQKIKGIPIRWEQQLFIGFAPLLPILMAILSEKNIYLLSRNYFCLFMSFVLLVIITLNYNNFSLWYFLHGLPLFSAIRAVSRIDLLFLFPISLFMAAAIDILIKKSFLPKAHILIFFSCILLIEDSAVKALTSTKLEWLERLSLKDRGLENNIDEKSILFFAQNSFSFESEELDGMLVAQKRNLVTLNGYSGAMPHHFHALYGDDCAEYPRRIILYLDFIGEGKNKEAYKQIARRVLPVGFIGCEESWRAYPPMTVAHRALTADEISQLSLELAPKSSVLPPGYLRIRIINHGQKDLSSLSLVDQNLRLAWRLIGADGRPKGAWSAPRTDLPTGSLPQGYRRDLPGDIISKGYIDVLVPIPENSLDKFTALEFSIVQEATLWGFSINAETNIWAHDVGLVPLIVNIPSE